MAGLPVTIRLLDPPLARIPAAAAPKIDEVAAVDRRRSGNA